jgi:hypothetical protein
MPGDEPIRLQVRLPYASKIEMYVDEEGGGLTPSKREVRLLLEADGTVSWDLPEPKRPSMGFTFRIRPASFEAVLPVFRDAMDKGVIKYSWLYSNPPYVLVALVDGEEARGTRVGLYPEGLDDQPVIERAAYESEKRLLAIRSKEGLEARVLGDYPPKVIS